MAGWRVVPYHIAAASRQLELTEALWREVAAGEAPATLRWYGYEMPALVLGIGQASDAIRRDAAREAGLEVLKRSSGGAVVFAGPDLIALDVALPSSSRLVIPDVVESYRWLGEVFLEGLESVSSRAGLEVVSPEAARADQSAQRASPVGTPGHARALACFGVLSPYEIALEGRGKLIGFSQVRKRGVVLFQVGFYTRFSGESLAAFLPETDGLGGELDRRIGSLSAIGLDSPKAVIAAVTRSIERRAPQA